MGNTIIKASHVGTADRRVAKYSGPPSDEDIAVAKRAAERTREAWAEQEKKRKEKEKADLRKRKKAEERKKAAKEKHKDIKARPVAAGPTSKNNAQNKNEKLDGNFSKTIDSEEVKNSKDKTPAQKLGITQDELDRRLRALQKFKSED